MKLPDIADNLNQIIRRSTRLRHANEDSFCVGISGVIFNLMIDN